MALPALLGGVCETRVTAYPRPPAHETHARPKAFRSQANRVWREDEFGKMVPESASGPQHS